MCKTFVLYHKKTTNTYILMFYLYKERKKNGLIIYVECRKFLRQHGKDTY